MYSLLAIFLRIGELFFQVGNPRPFFTYHREEAFLQCCLCSGQLPAQTGHTSACTMYSLIAVALRIGEFFFEIGDPRLFFFASHRQPTFRTVRSSSAHS